MPTPIERTSLKTDLASRYVNQPTGGAFNAKEITTEGGHASLEKDGHASIQSSTWTSKGFKVRMAQALTEFKEKALNFINTQGLDTRKYKG
jgi:hypothetical protein